MQHNGVTVDQITEKAKEKRDEVTVLQMIELHGKKGAWEQLERTMRRTVSLADAFARLNPEDFDEPYAPHFGVLLPLKGGFEK